MDLKHEFTYDERHPHAMMNIGKGSATAFSGFIAGLLLGLFFGGLFMWILFFIKK